jgi:hypothetical protein
MAVARLRSAMAMLRPVALGASERRLLGTAVATEAGGPPGPCDGSRWACGSTMTTTAPSTATSRTRPSSSTLSARCSPQRECAVEREEGAEALTIELLQPTLGGVECGAVGGVIDEEHAAVVGGGDGVKALLAGSVPDLAVLRGGGGPVLCGGGG